MRLSELSFGVVLLVLIPKDGERSPKSNGHGVESIVSSSLRIVCHRSHLFSTNPSALSDLQSVDFRFSFDNFAAHLDSDREIKSLNFKWVLRKVLLLVV